MKWYKMLWNSYLISVFITWKYCVAQYALASENVMHTNEEI